MVRSTSAKGPLGGSGLCDQGFGRIDTHYRGTAIGGTLYASQLSANQAKLATQNIAPDMIDRLSAVESFKFVILLATFVSIASVLTAAFTGKKKKAFEWY